MSWRVAFLINLPLSAIALWLTFAHVPESRDENATGPLDWTGSALAAVSLGALTYALTVLSDENGGGLIGACRPCARAPPGWSHSGLPSDAPKIRSCRRCFFDSRPFLVINIVTLFLYGALSAVMFLLPFDLIARRGMAASAVGMTFIPFGLIIGLLSRRSGGLADRYGARNFLVGGSLVVALGAGWIALSLEEFWIGVFVPLIVMALGMAAVVTPLTTVVMNSAPDAQAGAASGINNAASRVAGLVAVAVLGYDRRSAVSLDRRDARRAVRRACRLRATPHAQSSSTAFVVAYSGAMAYRGGLVRACRRDGVLLAHRAGLHGVRGARPSRASA